MKKILLISLALLSVSVMAQSSKTGGKDNAGSIYQQGSLNPLLDLVARGKGDIVMINITEGSASNFTASTTANKSTSNNIGSVLFNNFFENLLGPLSTAGTGANSGTGSTNYQSSMKTQMSAVVKEVLPNGYLVIEGTRTLVTNKETQTYVLSGLIRPIDIKSDNSIDSMKIAEAEIKLESTGQIAEKQRKGILSKFLDWLF